MSGIFRRLKDRAARLRLDTYALYLASRDPRTPLAAKLIAAATVAYAASPIDLIPDFIPVLGYLDDLVIVPLGFALAIRLIPPEVLADCRERARAALDQPHPRRWLAAAAVVVIWLALAALCTWLVVRAIR